jgi:hypothetical protein
MTFHNEKSSYDSDFHKLDFIDGIKIYYEHSRRIPYHSIIMEIRHNKIFVKSAQMEGKTGYEYSNFEKEIEITQEYYEMIYQKFIKINYNEIIDKSNEKNIIGLDGSSIIIIMGTFQNKMEVLLWSINYKNNERNTNGLLNILKEVFLLFNLENYIE